MKTSESKLSKSSHSSQPFLDNDKTEPFFADAGQKDQAFFDPHFIQPKLKVGKPDDQYEQEADRMADQVMRMPDHQVQRQPEEEEKRLQMKSEGIISSAGENLISSEVSNQLNANSEGGRSLPENVQSEMSKKMGADFDGVSIHADSEASRLNQQLGARAFTHGKDIYFNKGEYSPESSKGKRLLAHELTHVVQQGNASFSSLIQRQRIFDFSEEEGSNIVSAVEQIAGSGASAGEREVESQITSLRDWVNLYLGAYRDGLNSFSDTMSFSSDSEARPRYFDVALKEVGKVLLDELIDYATSEMPIVGPVVKGAKSVITALYDEAQRARTAQGEARIRSYIVSTRNAISEEGGIQRQLLEIMDAARPALLSRYRNAVETSTSGAPGEAARQSMIEAQGTHGYLVGEAATFIRDLRAQVEQFKNRIPTASQFQRRFTEQFADTPGLTDYVSQGGEESGSLHLNMEVYRERHGSGDSFDWSFRIDDIDSSWRLATSAPGASRLAQSLKDTIGNSVENTSLPKYLHVRVETEVFGLNDYSNAVIYFRESDNLILEVGM